MDYQQQTVLTIASLCALLFFSGLGLIYLLFTLKARTAHRRLTSTSRPRGADLNSSERRTDLRVTPPAIFLSYARRARPTPRDKLIQSIQAGVDLDQAARELSIPGPDAKLIWKSHCAANEQISLENEASPSLATATLSGGS
jgi:hypothetical protein